MRFETTHDGSVHSLGYTLGVGVVGGLIGGVGMGVVLYATSNVMTFVGSLYGWPSPAGGWLFHLANSVVLGVLFAAIVSRPSVRRRCADAVDYVICGLVFATVIGLVNGGILLPVAANAVETGGLPELVGPVPGVLGALVLTLSVGTAHLIYGLLLGTAYSYASEGARLRRA